jgi:DNA-binding transcriptional LysR family regulator
MIDKLEYLLALHHTRHFGRAAETCGVTQPTLSAGIRQLEAMLGVLLVQRTSRYVGLTTEGERVRDWARRIVSDSRTMRQEIKSLKQGLAGRLRIGCIPPALAMMPKLTTPYHAQHPEVRFLIQSRTSSETLSLIENLEIDAGVVYQESVGSARVTAFPLYEEHYQLIVTDDSPFAKRKSVTWAEAAEVPLCLMTMDTQNRRLIERLLRGAGGKPLPMLESNSMIVLFSHVRTGRWATIMAAELADMLGLTGTVRAIPIVEPQAKQLIVLIVPDREPTAPLTAALIRQARRLASASDTSF